MQTPRSHGPIPPDVTAAQAPAPKAASPAPGAPGWKAPARRSPNPGCPSWEAPSALVPNPGSPTWEAPSKAAVGPAAAKGATPSDPAGLGKSHASTSSARSRGVVVAAVALLVLVAALYVGGTSSLKSKLEGRTWSRYDDSLRLELDFDGDEIAYSAHALFISSTIAHMDYIVVSPSGMMVTFGDNWRYISVDIDDDVMRLSPAITDISDEEYWF